MSIHTTVPRHVARLVTHLQESGSTTETNTALAAALGVTTRSVRYGISDGVELGLLVVERRASNGVTDPSGRTITLVGA
jgi:hypothetical protein